MKTRTLRQDKVNVITLGCSKNLVDSEDMITQLRANDYDVVHDSNEEDANVIIVNTCGFIDLVHGRRNMELRIGGILRGRHA